MAAHTRCMIALSMRRSTPSRTPRGSGSTSPSPTAGPPPAPLNLICLTRSRPTHTSLSGCGGGRSRSFSFPSKTTTHCPGLLVDRETAHTPCRPWWTLLCASYFLLFHFISLFLLWTPSVLPLVVYRSGSSAYLGMSCDIHILTHLVRLVYT
jgi:hypothetical protein